MSYFKRKLIVTCALPYANGPIHLGHLLEHIQADIWVRYQRMQNNKVYFICADDAHGTPVMLKAQELKITSEQMIFKIQKEHEQDFVDFNIKYDNYHSTHSHENKELSALIYNRLKDNGFIKSRIISQFYDCTKKIFLPDRFIKGICPICKSINQYGDNCEHCGTTYKPTDLINPKSVISNTTPELRNSKHLFFDLPFFKNMLKTWIYSGVMQNQVVNKIQEWFNSGLQEWNISRDAPYFGFKIPNEVNKYFYVWLDAPIGYIASFKNLCNKRCNINFNEFWNKNSTTELYHFIGKDIIYFHGLFWPAILEGSNFRKPNNIFVHGHLTINGLKMSKSHGTFITAKTWLNNFDSDSLRYYYATKLSSCIEDIDLNLEDFVQRVNSDIVNKIVNLAARNASFITKCFNGFLSKIIENEQLHQTFLEASETIGNYWYNREFSNAIRHVIKFANLANRYIDTKAPWKIAQQKEYNEKLQSICSLGINLFRILIIWLKPVLPILGKNSEYFLDCNLNWNDIKYPLLNHQIKPFKMLYNRIEKNQVRNLLDEANIDILYNHNFK